MESPNPQLALYGGTNMLLLLLSEVSIGAVSLTKLLLVHPQHNWRQRDPC